jgi:hypothetical protein
LSGAEWNARWVRLRMKYPDQFRVRMLSNLGAQQLTRTSATTKASRPHHPASTPSRDQ